MIEKKHTFIPAGKILKGGDFFCEKGRDKKFVFFHHDF